MGLILHSLPRYTGPYPVSTHDVELASSSPDSARFSHALLKSTHQPALQLETTLFTLFYPTNTDTPKSRSMPWLERPLSTTARGYAKFLGKSTLLVKAIVYLFGRSLYLATQGIDQPLLLKRMKEKEEKAGEYEKFPVVVFSHGLSGNRTTYSQYCGELASRGYVVVAVEHRDGSGPITVVKPADGDPRKEKVIDYIKEKDIYYENEKDQQPFLKFRGDQLSLRQAEISEILSTLARINRGASTEELERSNRRAYAYGKNGAPFRWEEWKGRLDLEENMTMAGHSFGGATTIQILRSNSKFGFKKGLALDPWADPIPPAVIELETNSTPDFASSSGTTLISTPNEDEEPKSSPAPAPTSTDDTAESKGISVPFLVINSEAFTLWKPHFYLVRNIVNSIRNSQPSWFFTILGSVHISFSDLPLFLPSYLSPKSATTPALTSHSLIVETSLEFLRGEYEEGKYLGAEIREKGDEEYVNPSRGEGEKGPLKREDGEGFVRMHVKRNVAGS
ncbi:uncharacterized protein JCM6883_006878 [Sporobolomyces salmoneus]|uniref:uncharacterized protein n=1 Tax=Sporobolomyces salmoneus TaxID=183962 RepID=UPI00316EEA96